MNLKFLVIMGFTLIASTTISYGQNYPIVDSDLSDFYNNNAIISAPSIGQAFYGQDAHYNGNQPSYTNNGDGTITDNATGLMWQQADDGNTRDWENALPYCENLTLAGYSDWRLPNAKELHSIVDYTRCPAVTNSPAIDPLFSCTSFNNPDGNPNYGYYWTSSPLMDGPTPYTDAVYICFGEAQGQMSLPPTNTPSIYDTHGAGAQRNDPKEVGTDTYPTYFGPQGDILYVNNFVRAVRDINSTLSTQNQPKQLNINVHPNPTEGLLMLKTDKIYNQLDVKVINILGKIVAEYSFENKNQLDIEVNGSSGIYFIYVQSENGELTTFKIIKE